MVGTSSGKKESDVKNLLIPTISNNVLFRRKSCIYYGESVRVYSEDGIVPGGIESGKIILCNF